VEAEIDYGNYKVTIRKSVTINALPSFDLGPNRTVCDGTVLSANVDGSAVYLWNTGATTKTITPRSSGFYSAITEYESTGCKFYDEVELIVNETPFVNLGPDSVVCNNPPYVLKSRTQLSNIEYKWNDPSVTGPELPITNGGFYFLEAKSLTNGCAHRDSIFLALKFAPEPNLGPDRSINLDESFVLDVSEYGPGEFKWEDNSTYPIRNIEGRKLGIGPTTLGLSITGFNGCIGNDEMIVTVLNVVGIEENKQFYFYPMPANNTLFIETPNRVSVSLLTITGTLLLSKTIEPGKASMDLSTYS